MKVENFPDLARSIFIKWEFLRVFYNLIIVVVIVGRYVPMLGIYFLHYGFLGVWISALFWSNLLFFLAPALETYLAWLGEKSWIITVAIFGGLIVVALPFVTRYSGTVFSAMS